MDRTVLSQRLARRGEFRKQLGLCPELRSKAPLSTAYTLSGSLERPQAISRCHVRLVMLIGSGEDLGELGLEFTARSEKRPPGHHCLEGWPD